MKKERSVLVVDDCPAIAERLANILYKAGTADVVMFASDCDQAFNILQHRETSVLMIDINLPGKSGLELLRMVHETDIKTKVMMVSNQSGNYYRDLCSSLGASYFFDKSDDFDRIPFIVSQLECN
jgi:DNA-binding NarL/FixJ family response regulator